MGRRLAPLLLRPDRRGDPALSEEDVSLRATFQETNSVYPEAVLSGQGLRPQPRVQCSSKPHGYIRYRLHVPYASVEIHDARAQHIATPDDSV